jgi:hypothetical protein
MDVLAYSPDQITAFWSGVTPVTAVSTALVAIFSLLSLRRDSPDRSRPVISADLLPLTLSHGTCELVIENVGRSVAKDVQVTFDPEITEDLGAIAAFLARRYDHVIPTMGPGRRLTNVYGNQLGDGSGNLDEQVPRDVTLTITYKDARDRRYEDRYELTVQTLLNQTTSSPSNTDERGMQRRLLAALEAIARGVGRE